MKRVILACLVVASFSAIANDAPDALANLVAISHEDGFKRFSEAINMSEREAFLKEGDTINNFNISKGIFTPSMMVDIYNEGNELKAKMLFSTNYRVKFKINEISLDAFNNNVITAIVPTDNPYIKETVSFRGLSDDQVIEMKKGQKLDLVCNGAEYVIKNIFAKNCKLTEDFIKEQPDLIPSSPESSDFTNKMTGFYLAYSVKVYEHFRLNNGGSDGVFNMKPKEILKLLSKSKFEPTFTDDENKAIGAHDNQK